MLARSVSASTAIGFAAVVLTGCGGSSTDDGAGSESYGHALEAPPASAFDGGDTSPDPEDGRVELSLDSGAQVVIWFDPDDIAKVYEQHSDPNAGDDAATADDAWTEPRLLYTAGDGCLIDQATTDGTIVAATFGCYETDAFLQQAGDQGQAVVSTDLQDWEIQESGEIYEKPSISDDGDTVTWPNGPTWTTDGGFS